MCEQCKKAKVESQKLQAAVKPLGHIPKYTGVGLSDQYECSCGWKSSGYWDGSEWAWDEWIKHAKGILEAGQARLALQPLTGLFVYVINYFIFLFIIPFLILFLN